MSAEVLVAPLDGATTSWPVRLLRFSRLFLLLTGIALGTLCYLPFLHDARRLRLRQRWSRQLLEILAIRLECPSGAETSAPPGTLIVANHVSWLDVFVINSLRPSSFVAKSEVRCWPFFGWLAARHETVFLRRGSRGHARVVNGEIDALLNAGKDVAIFPEGTTSDGSYLLGFHAALMQPAVETGRPILPLTVSYHDADGRYTRGPAFAGETTLLQSFATILASRSLIARLTPAAPIATAGRTRREVVREAHAAIAATLTTTLGFPPASTPPGI